MEKIDATYQSNFSFSVRKWHEIKSGFTHFADGDVAFAKITPCFQNRKSMILKGLPNGIGAGTTELKVLRTYGNTISTEYLLFFLESPYFVEEAIFKGTANQQRIISGYLENKLFPIPPQKEQQRIVDIINASFTVAETYSKAQEKLDSLNNSLAASLRKSILQEAIQGKLVPQDPNDEPASVLLERIRDEKERLIKEGKIKRPKKSKATSDKPHYENVPFEIPDGWCWTTIEDVCSKIGSGSTPKGSNYSKEGIPFFRSQNVQNDGIVLSDIKYISDEVHQSMIGTEVVANDLLLNITGGSLGRCAVVPRDFDIGNVSQHVCILRTVLVKPEYLHCFILSSFFSKSMKITGSGREGLPKYNLEKMLLPLPPIQEQERIIIEAKQLQNNIDKIDTCNGNLVELISRTKSKILDLAIHGKLVPQDPTDEPASELLKRINPKAEITCDNGHYQKLPEGWVITPMQTLCALVDGEKQNGIERINLDVKYLRGEREAKVLTSGKYTAAKTLLILVDGENSGEVFRAPVDGYQGSTFKRLSIHEVMYTDYVLQVINLHRKTLRENKVGSAIPHLNKKLFKAINVPIPPYEEQKRIVNAINQTFTILDKIMENL